MISVIVPVQGNLVGEGFDEVFQMDTPSSIVFSSFGEEHSTSWDDLDADQDLPDDYVEMLLKNIGAPPVRCPSFGVDDQYVNSMFTGFPFLPGATAVSSPMPCLMYWVWTGGGVKS